MQQEKEGISGREKLIHGVAPEHDVASPYAVNGHSCEEGDHPGPAYT